MKAVAIDLDGTLLNSKHKVSDFSKKILNHLHNKGVKIILASARPIQSVLNIAKEMGRIREAGEFEYQKPSSIDPEEMRRRLQNYWKVKDLLEGTNKSEPVEAKEIFGKKDTFDIAKEMFA